MLVKFFTTYALNTGGSAETCRIVIAYSEKVIHTIKHMGVFCVDKAGFLRLSLLCYFQWESTLVRFT